MFTLMFLKAVGVYCCGVFNEQCCYYEIYQLWCNYNYKFSNLFYKYKSIKIEGFWVIWSFILLIICACTFGYRKRRLRLMQQMRQTPCQMPAVVTVSGCNYNGNNNQHMPYPQTIPNPYAPQHQQTYLYSQSMQTNSTEPPPYSTVVK